MANKWDCDTTIRFIELYKLYPCLWNFQSVNYKCKDKRHAAYVEIAKGMNLPDFGVIEVKNKIKNLRSTYSQEMKKMQESKKGNKPGAVYVSNLKWREVMKDVFLDDFKRTKNTDDVKLEDNQLNYNQDTDFQDRESVYQDSDQLERELRSNTHKSDGPRAKKRTRESATIVSDSSNLHDTIVNFEEEGTALDIFGKSVAIQLKALSVENALLAQCRIQSILTEFGIKNHREMTSSHASTPESIDQKPFTVEFVPSRLSSWQ